MKPSVVDLFELRCAVAVLAHADHNIDDHTTVDLLRLGSAIRHISRLRRQMHGHSPPTPMRCSQTMPTPQDDER